LIKAANSKKTRLRTIVDIPNNLLVEIDEALEQGVAKSRNAFMIQAIQFYLKQLRRQWVDEQFEQLQHDKRYQRLNLQISEELAKADWEAWQIGEGKVSEVKDGR
jgi:hypothetical protein